MDDILAFFAPEHWIALGLLIFLLCSIGGRFVRIGSPVHRLALAAAALALVGYAGLAIARLDPRTPSDFLIIAIRATFAAGLTLTLCFVLLPMLAFVYRKLLQEPVRKVTETTQLRAQIREAEKKEQERREQWEAERRQKDELARIAAEEQRNQPPPPTREELIARAKERHEKTLRILETAGLDELEMNTARAKAKQR